MDAHRKYSRRKHSVVAMQEYLRVDFQRKSLLLCGFHIRFESKQDLPRPIAMLLPKPRNDIA